MEISILICYIDNTNSKHLELYSTMGEYDNAGFPMTYCLLSTATAIDLGKRKKSITAWSRCLRDKYGVNPEFIHTDKDMGEIGAVKDVWEAKINLCWWHLRRAVRTRLAKTKLATSPYNLSRAMAEYSFIKPDFIPAGMRVDINDYEGGIPDDALPDHINNVSLPITEPFAGQPPTIPTPTPPGNSTNVLRIKLPLPSIASAIGRVIRGTGFRISFPATRLPAIVEEEEVVDSRFAGNEKEASINDDDDDEKEDRRTFCPPLYREAIIKMMERHYCAHPSIPGSCPPDTILIKRWVVQCMYDFCVKHERPEVWVYLWENWYRTGRWELWARSAHKLIPVLKTTMILESQ